ncbi:MAG: hypothetical protein H3C35_10740 [Bacteroidetes bacterium]|nr:hypothetical protein [Bacteroidota bacterium]
MTPTTHNIIPEGEHYCVWMDAGLVNFKLCDRNYECEHCPFDAVIRSQNGGRRSAEDAGCETKKKFTALKAESSENIDTIICRALDDNFQNISSQHLPEKRRYFSNHTWMMPLNEHQCVIGIDHFLANIVSPIRSVATPQPPTYVQHNAPCAWLLRGTETLAVRAPIAGDIVEVNPLLMHNAIRVNDDPYESGWLVKCSPKQPSESLASYEASQFHQVLKQDSEKLRTMFYAEFQRSRPRIGTSMYDGGAIIDNIEQIIGTKKFIEIINRLLLPASGKRR